LTWFGARIRPAHEWKSSSRGIKQRVRASDAFVADIYHDQISESPGLPPNRSRQFAVPPGEAGIPRPGGIYAHTAESEIVRDD